MTAPGKWGDLRVRVLSGLAVAALGIAAIWAGGPWFVALVVAAVGLMIWELATMTAPAAPGEARALGGAAALALVAVLVLHEPFALALLALVPLAGAARPRRDAWIFALYGFAVMLAGYGLVAFRGGYGLPWLLWLVALVIASDVLGYFGGRILGGPKFWPRVSPKKTWSGTVSGWLGAALVAAGFVAAGKAGPGLVLISPLVAFAAQMGDIAESAVKRRMGVKDSSNLIPGHGGVLDRFDALIGATLAMLLWALLFDAPAVGG